MSKKSDIKLMLDSAQYYLKIREEEKQKRHSMNNDLLMRLKDISEEFIVVRKNLDIYDYFDIRVNMDLCGISFWLSNKNNSRTVEPFIYSINFNFGCYNVQNIYTTFKDKFATAKDVIGFLGKEIMAYSGLEEVNKCFIKIDKNNE